MKYCFVGPVELAAVGVSIAIFNQVSKIAIIPLVSVTTSLVAEEDAVEKLQTQPPEQEMLINVSSANEEIKLEVEEQIEQTGIYFLFSKELIALNLYSAESAFGIEYLLLMIICETFLFQLVNYPGLIYQH